MNTKALHQLSYGVYIVTSVDGDGKPNGQISNTVFQVTSEPPKIEIAINKLNLTHEFISKRKLFAVCVLNTEVPMTYIGRFGFRSGRDFPKFEGIEYDTTANGLAVPKEHTTAYVECKVVDSLDVGTHTLFIGEAIGAEVYSQDEPLTYAYYHQIKKGKEPKTAPTYEKAE